MAFTYTGDLSTNRDKVRRQLADTVSGSGPLPQDGNFTDAEIDGFITSEGSWQRAVAAGFEALAAAWMRYPTFDQDGFRLSRTDIAKGYATEAARWRKRYGGSSTGAGARVTTRVDGYSDDVAADSV